MNEVSNLPAVYETSPQEAVPVKKAEMTPVLKDKPDVYEKSKITAGGVITAGVAASGLGFGVYKTSLSFLDKGIKLVEREIGNYLTNLRNAPVKTNIMYGGAILAAVTASLLAFKDSNKNGKFDIIEAVEKFI